MMKAGEGDGEKMKQLPAWGIVLLVSTLIFFLVAIITIDYTFGTLIPTLLMIESPADNIAFEPLPTDDTDAIIKDPEHGKASPEPITASFRRTLRHLGGFRARFRGFWLYFLTGVAVTSIGSAISKLPIFHFIPTPFWNTVAIILCATLPLTWNHIVISQPKAQPWFRRLAPTKMWKKVAAPTAIAAFAEQLTVYLPLYLSYLLGLTKAHQVPYMSAGQQTGVAFKALALLVFSFSLKLFVSIPAQVVLVRVQASLLPDTEESIVPFDRTFGGKVVPEIVGGSGAIGMRDALTTFDWASRIRLVKAYLKVFGMQVLVTVLFTVLFIGEMFLIVGTNWSQYLPKDGDQQL